MLVRIGISVQAEEVDVCGRFMAVDCRAISLQYEAWTICVLVGIKQDVCSVVFVVTGGVQLENTITAGATANLTLTPVRSDMDEV